MKKRIKIKSLVFLGLLLSLCIISNSFAVFVSGESFVNKFKTMTYNVVLEEEFYNRFGTKKVVIANRDEDSAPVVLRVNYNEIWSKDCSDSVRCTLSNSINGVPAVTKEWSGTFNEDFVLGDDGWYYYRKLLKYNDEVLILNSITLNDSLIRDTLFYNDYKTYDYELTFNYESILASVDAVKDIWGLDVSIDGDNVVWDF